MASLNVFKPTLTPLSRSGFDSGRKSNPNCYCWQFASGVSKKRVMRLSIHHNWKHSSVKRLRVICVVDESQHQSEEPPESLFTKELKKRGITRTLLEDRNFNPDSYKINEKIYFNDKERDSSKDAFSSDIQKELLNQRDRSIALNSEGLEGLIPRGKVLLTLGGTFFLGFVPFILVTVSSFFALYLLFGSRFVHDGSGLPVEPPKYVNPYALLDDQRLS